MTKYSYDRYDLTCMGIIYKLRLVINRLDITETYYSE